MKHKELTLLFDCDGTLLKSLGFGMDSFNEALAHVGARPHEPDEIKRFFGRSADKIFHQLLGDPARAQAAYEVYLQVEERLVSRVLPHVGIIDLLERLKRAGARLGVVTGRHSRDLSMLFRHTRIGPYFEVLVCDDALQNPKPHPEGIRLACARLGADVRQCYYVGDAVMDIQAARAAQAQGIAALWDPWVVSEEMEKAGPVLMAKTPKEIWHWLEAHYEGA